MTVAPRGGVDPRDLLRSSVLVLLVVGPVACGAVHELVSIPILAVAYTTGLISWARGHWARARGVPIPHLPGARLLLIFNAIVAVQLVPLPPTLLRVVSPGTHAFHDARSLIPFERFAPISVSPPDTLRGLLFLGGMSLLCATVFREFDEPRWRKRLALTIVLTALGITIEALIQGASSEPTKIYGIWKPRWDYAVFGPYLNHTNFAGYIVMAFPLALSLASQAAQELGQAWKHRRRGVVAIGERPGQNLFVYSTAALALVVGLFAARSRGGVVAALVSAAAVALAFRRRFLAGVVIALVMVSALRFTELDPVIQDFEKRGVRGSRLELWADAIRMVPHFPWMGAGFNAFGTAYPDYQTFYKEGWWSAVHNEYLQVVIDTGVGGAAFAAPLLVLLFVGATRAARRGGLAAGLLGALIASAVSNLVDLNWQVPANAVTFAAIAGMALREGSVRPGGGTPHPSLPGKTGGTGTGWITGSRHALIR